MLERGWEYKQICVTRVPGYGFGIAVSGGRDNPHFASGDPSIAVSDVLASGPAERLLQVNDRIISVNGISLQNVDYATAVQVLRDSGDTVTLVVKRRTAQHSHSHSASFNGPPLAALGVSPLPAKVTLTKNSKKEDFGIVLGCKLFIKEISSKARDQLINTNQVLEVGDFLTKLNNTNCNDVMSLKEAKKIIDSTKDKLHITVSRDFGFNSSVSHQTQSSISTTGAVNNFYKGDDFLTSSPQSYSNQNLYVQPPTRNPNLNQNGGFEEKLEQNSGPNSLPDEKSNLAPRGRSRGPLSEANLNQLENRNSIAGYGRSKGREEPPRPPPPRAEDYYSTRRQIYEDDPIIQKTKQPIPDARFITFHKEGSVGIRLTGGNFAGIFVTAVQPGSPASLQGLQPGDKILKVNDMDMNGVTREEAVLFLLSLQDRIELIVQFCKEEYDSIVASQKGDSFYIKTHFHYENPAKGEMSFRSGDIFHVIDTLYNGVVGCWQVFRIGRNNQEVQKGIIPNKSRAEELATAQFNATKKEMSANESRGSFFKRRRSSNRRSKSLGKEHWDDILFSDTVSKFPAYERVLLKHPGFTRPVILFGPIADVAREKLLKDFPDKFISPQLDATVEETSSKHKSSTNSNIIRLSAIRDVISTGKHALLDITPNAVERLNYAQMYPIVVFFKAETKMVVKQLRQGLPKSAHKSSKKLLEQCQKLDKVWSHVFSSTITLNDNTDTWYRKVREIIDKQQSNALWMSESKGYDLYSDIYFPQIYLQPRSTSSLPYRQRQSRSRHRKTALSMYSSPQFIHRTTPYTSCYAPYEYYPYMSPVPSQSTLYQENYPNPEESLSDDFLFPMSSLRLSYASSPESDLEHSPGPPTSPGLSGNGTTAGRLTKASSDPSVVMPDCSTTDVLPPYQPNYDSRYGFGNNQQQQQPPPELQTPPTDSPLTKDPSYTLSNPDIPSSLEAQNPYTKNANYNDKNPIYSSETYQKPEYPKMTDARNEFGSRNDFNSPERRTDFSGERNMQHKRQASTLHGVYGHSKGHNMEQSPSKDAVYGQVPDLPPRVDRAIKPMGLLMTPSKIPNGRSAHERLFGTKANPQVEGADTNPPDNNNFNNNNKAGSLERSQNSKSDSLSSYDSFNKQSNTRIGPNAHDDLKTTLSKIDPAVTNLQNSPSKYGSGPRWEQNVHRHGSKLDLKYGLPPTDQHSMDNSPRNSREMDKESSPMDAVCPRGSVERDMYRYSRSPAKQHVPGKPHMETKTDYGKYSRNNNSSHHPSQPPPEYTRNSHQDLRESSLSIHQQSPLRSPPMHHQNGYDSGPPNHLGPPNGNTYKPVPPPKPKNYKPPYKQGYAGDGMVQPPPVYQHGKSHSNPVDQRNQNMNLSPHHNYYYNSPPNHNSYHTETAMRYPGHYDMAPPYQESPRRHPSISYASRSEITPIAHQHENPYGMEHHPGEILDARPPVVDLQGSREQRGSAFELYRKPVGHNMRGLMDQPAFYGSQPNIAQKLNTSSATNSPKITPKLTKAQSFKHQKSEGFITPKLFRKLSFTRKSRESTPKMNKKLSLQSEPINENQVVQDFNRNAQDFSRPSKRDITSAIVDHKGAVLVNEYWGVSLEVPEGAIPKGQDKQIYFVISDPRLCDNAPPLDLDNGETMLSPLVMCGPQGTEFLKPVILNIPHYANTLPSLGISLKATDSEQDIHTDWDNILLPSNHAANSVAVKVDHF
ncbi:tight junction protein ZO-1 isoform X2 [Anoplophora glabripennis]|uniref:tight junction protein ZO-1 isoform X2 n=1 Tax=Anoplophora glabripennis TaxID=217634 RepID=UPI000873C332|nr:tight junction protein ZO-1 isoform X2 [Anoplophora glabripennis]